MNEPNKYNKLVIFLKGHAICHLNISRASDASIFFGHWIGQSMDQLLLLPLANAPTAVHMCQSSGHGGVRSHRRPYPALQRRRYRHLFPLPRHCRPIAAAFF